MAYDAKSIRSCVPLTHRHRTYAITLNYICFTIRRLTEKVQLVCHLHNRNVGIYIAPIDTQNAVVT